MSLLPVHRQPRGTILSEPLKWFSGFPPMLNLARLLEGHTIRVEDDTVDGNYVLRAEIPGIDPAHGVNVTVRDGLLTVNAERTQSSETKGHSEFSYGSYTRTVTLPTGAQEHDIAATYDKGILTVTVPVSEATPPTEKHIEVKTGS